jgi:hypothetical protein
VLRKQAEDNFSFYNVEGKSDQSACLGHCRNKAPPMPTVELTSKRRPVLLVPSMARLAALPEGLQKWAMVFTRPSRSATVRRKLSNSSAR